MEGRNDEGIKFLDDTEDYWTVSEAFSFFLPSCVRRRRRDRLNFYVFSREVKCSPVITTGIGLFTTLKRYICFDSL